METKSKSSSRITPEEVKLRLDNGEKLTFIDVRNAQPWADSGFKIPGAIRISLAELQQCLPLIPRTEPLITYCT
ncbi:MAG: hypothetical protein IPM23_09675 [Candidatus Melainabacteria bacterium]|jgi:rhodanese-related sulfurtransferase|nr:hypothetical protein [Candidatus Melainabacteria bacterium]